MHSAQHILVTGASGYIGARLVELALERGSWVTVLGRSSIPVWMRSSQFVRLMPWRLGDPLPEGAFDPSGSFPAVDAVIHAAHQWVAGDSDPNILGSRTLILAARARSLRLVFCSSISARTGALNHYGRVKRAIELLLEGPKEIAARIGLVYGGPRRGQWGTLVNLVVAAPVVPMVASEAPVQPIHRDDLCKALLRLADRDGLSMPMYALADSSPIPFRDFLRLMARQLFDKRLRVIHVPVAPVLMLIDVINRMRLLPHVDRERVLGLAGLLTVPSADALAELGITLRPLAEGLAAEARHRRDLIAEAKILLRYVGGAVPGSFPVRTYVRAVERQPRSQPLAIPLLAKRYAGLFSVFEPINKTGLPAERLYLASLVSDAIGPRVVSTYPYDRDGFLRAVLSLVAVTLREGMLLPLRAVLGLRSR